MKAFITIIILSFTSIGSLNAASYTWTGNTSTAWNNAGNWSPGTGFPSGTGDNVTIVSATNMPVLDQNRTINALTVTSGTLDLNTFTLQCNGNVNANGGTLTNGLLKPRGTQGNFAGTYMDVTVDALCGLIKLNGGTFTKVCRFEDTSALNSAGDGGCTFNDSLYIIHTGTGGKFFKMAQTTGNTYNGPVVLTNTSDEDIWMSIAGSNSYNDNIIVNNTGTKGITFGINGGTSTLASGKTISVGSSGFTADLLSLINFTQSGSTSQTLTLTGTASMVITSSTFNGGLTVTAPGFLLKNSVFNGVSSFTKNGTSNFHSYGGNSFNNDVMFENNGSAGRIRLATTAPDIFDELALFFSTGQAIQVAYAGVNDFYGGIEINHPAIVFNEGSGTCRLKGNSTKYLSEGHFSFNNLTIEMASQNQVHLNATSSVSGVLNLLQGKVNANGLLTMNVGSSVTNASNSSFVSGPVQKIGNTSFIFPVGKETYYLPLSMSAPTNVTDAFTAEYFFEGQFSGENLDSSLAYVTDCNYWSFTRDIGASDVSITLNWQLNCPVVDTTYLKIVSWQDDNWNDVGHGPITGNNSNGSISTPSVLTEYGYITLAYDSSIIVPFDAEQYIIGDGFTINQGQLLGTDSAKHPEILYYGGAYNTSLFLGDSVFSYVFSSHDSVYAPDSIFKTVKIDSLYRIDMKLKDIALSRTISATDTSQGYKNYFLSRLDTSYTNVLTYQEVRYSDIYTGIDLLFHNNDEFRFVLDSSALVSSIQFYYQGADSVKVNGEGKLSIYTPLGNKFYQVKSYALISEVWESNDIDLQKTDSIIGLNFTTVERNVPIIISFSPWLSEFPYAIMNTANKLKWCTSYSANGTYFDVFNAVHIDNNDRVYVAGHTFEPLFPVIAALYYTIGGNGYTDIGIVKFKPGRDRDFATFYGGSGGEDAFGITVDNVFNIYLTGYTFSPDFPICSTCSTYSSSFSGAVDAIIVKLNSTGNAALLATYYGGTQNDIAYSLVVDKTNSIYIGGGTAGGVPTPSVQPTNSFVSPFTANTNAGNSNLHDGFVAKFDASCALTWATHYGSDGLTTIGSKDEFIASLALNNSQNSLYVYGVTNCDQTQTCAAPCSTDVSPHFPITGSNYIYDTPSHYDLFIVKFNSDYQITWSTLFGGSSEDSFGAYGGNAYPTRGLAVSPLNDDVFITGRTLSADFETKDIGGTSYFDGSISSYDDAFIARFTSTDVLKWSTYYGGNIFDVGNSISINHLGQFVVTGITKSEDLDLMSSGLGAYYQPLINNLTVNNLNWDGFMLKFTPNCKLTYATYIGGAQDDIFISTDFQERRATNVVSVGYTGSPDFPWRDFIPNYLGDYSVGDPGLNVANYDVTPFVYNIYNYTTPLRIKNPNQISSTKIENSKSIYPNPTTSLITLNSSTLIINYRIFDLSGQKLMDGPIDAYKAELNIENLTNGLYILEFSSEKKLERFKILKIAP